MATLDRQHPRVNILKIVPKHAAKKQAGRAIVVTSLAHRPTFSTPASENIVGL